MVRWRVAKGSLGDCIPSKTKKIRPNDNPWFNSEIRWECRKRDRLRKIARRTLKERDMLPFKKQRNKVNNMRYHAKEMFYGNIDGLLFDMFKQNKPLLENTKIHS